MISQTIQYVTDLPDDHRPGLLPTDCLTDGPGRDLGGATQLLDTLAGHIAACARLLRCVQSVGAGVNLVFEKEACDVRTPLLPSDAQADDALLAELRAHAASDDRQPAASERHARTPRSSAAGQSNASGRSAAAVSAVSASGGDCPAELHAAGPRSACAAEQTVRALFIPAETSASGIADRRTLSADSAVQFRMPDTAAQAVAGVAALCSGSTSAVVSTQVPQTAPGWESTPIWTGVQTACNFAVMLNPPAPQPVPSLEMAAPGRRATTVRAGSNAAGTTSAAPLHAGIDAGSTEIYALASGLESGGGNARPAVGGLSGGGMFSAGGGLSDGGAGRTSSGPSAGGGLSDGWPSADGGLSDGWPSAGGGLSGWPSDGGFVMPDLATGITPAGGNGQRDLVGGSVAGISARIGAGSAGMANGGRAGGVSMTIGNLIGEFTINTTNLHEDAGRVKELVTEALISAVNDVNYG